MLQHFCSYWRRTGVYWHQEQNETCDLWAGLHKLLLCLSFCAWWQMHLLTRIGSSFNLFGVVLFALFFNSFTSSCNVSICFSNFLFCLQSAFFLAEVTGSAFFFLEILIWNFSRNFYFFNLSFSLFILINSSSCCLFNQSSAYLALFLILSSSFTFLCWSLFP